MLELSKKRHYFPALPRCVVREQILLYAELVEYHSILIVNESLFRSFNCTYSLFCMNLIFVNVELSIMERIEYRVRHNY